MDEHIIRTSGQNAWGKINAILIFYITLGNMVLKNKGGVVGFRISKVGLRTVKSSFSMALMA
jgi:hypothetical protein